MGIYLERLKMTIRQGLSKSQQVLTDPEAHRTPEGWCFPSTVIHPFHPTTKANRKVLRRGYEDEPILCKFLYELEGYTLVTYDGLMELGSQVRHCELNGIEGDYVELGAWRGGCIAMMAMCNLQYGKERRTIHAFDSFEGLPQPLKDKDIDQNFTRSFKVDEAQQEGKMEPINAVAAGESYLHDIVFKMAKYPKENVRIHKGWFQDTVPPAAQEIDKIAILRLDGDLYESYMVPLTHLYDKVVPGGFIIIDDWYFKGCREAVTEFFESRGESPYLHICDSTVRAFRKM